MADSIPIQNIYYLLCYAWDQLEEGKIIDVAAEDPMSLAELFAKVLANGTSHLVRRGFDRGYIQHSEETPRLRGRLTLASSMKHLSWLRGRMVCEFDELSHDILHNRILKTTIEKLLQVREIPQKTRNQLREQAGFLSNVRQVRLTSSLFRRVHLHRNNRFYRFLLNICELIHDSMLPEEETGHTRFRDFVRDSGKMPTLFEQFVRNFYKREQNEFQVDRITLSWQALGREEDLAVLPGMHTDVSLRSPDRSIILDCKFYKEAMSRHRGSLKIHSPNLYQLYAYIRNAESRQGWENSGGILLYPAVGTDFDHQYIIAGHPVRVVSVDLARPWREIHQRLLSILCKESEVFAEK